MSETVKVFKSYDTISLKRDLGRLFFVNAIFLIAYYSIDDFDPIYFYIGEPFLILYLIFLPRLIFIEIDRSMGTLDFVSQSWVKKRMVKSYKLEDIHFIFKNEQIPRPKMKELVLTIFHKDKTRPLEEIRANSSGWEVNTMIEMAAALKEAGVKRVKGAGKDEMPL
jgi:hypothetical protein